jgi:hypothetical protein
VSRWKGTQETQGNHGKSAAVAVVPASGVFGNTQEVVAIEDGTLVSSRDSPMALDWLNWLLLQASLSICTQGL